MKITVVFPGIGYHTDKPLLYYSKKTAASYGFEVVDVPYGGFRKGIKGNPEKMKQAAEDALSQTRRILKDIDFDRYETILFISKSVGTVVASLFAAERQLSTCNLFYTPVEASFRVMRDPGIIFHGTADPWMDHDLFMKEIVQSGYPYHLTEGANHSLETGEVLTDLENMKSIMTVTDQYIRSVSDVR